MYLIQLAHRNREINISSMRLNHLITQAYSKDHFLVIETEFE